MRQCCLPLFKSTGSSPWHSNKEESPYKPD